MAKLTVGKAIRAGLERKLESDPDVVLLGEDICDPYGGAFRVTQGLSRKFPGRVINTPISEAASAGVAAGLALRGQKPVLEMMFGDFVALAADQIINHIAKFSWMYNGQVTVPLVIRAPMGGRRGYGPTHSQSLEAMFLNTPGLRIVAPSQRHDATALIQAAIDDPNPVLFIEGKLLYATEMSPEPAAFNLQAAGTPYPTLILDNADGSADLTVVTYGEMLPTVERAMADVRESEEITCEIIVPSEIAPNHAALVGQSVERTGRLLVVEAGARSWGWGSEVVAQIAETQGQLLKALPARVGALDLPVPTARPLEDAVLPAAADIIKAVRNIFAA